MSQTDTHAGALAPVVIADQVINGPLQSTYRRSTILLLAGSIALSMTGFGIVMPVFARRLGELGGGVEALGFMTVAFAAAQFIASPIAGAQADRIGRRPVILLALFAFAATNIGYLLATSTTAFIVLRGLAGALTTGLSPAAMGVVADTAPENERGRWAGILMGGYGIGLIFGPVIGGLLYDAWGFAAPFLISAGIGAIAFSAAWIMVPETRTKAIRKREQLQQRLAVAQGATGANSLWASLPRPLYVFGMLLLVDFAGAFAFAFVEPQMVFYVYEQLHWSTVQFGLVVAAYGLILPPAVLQLPRLGCLNIHASLLPRWRGAAPIHRAIEAGDAETGITIMQMDEGLDTGPMLLSRALCFDTRQPVAFRVGRCRPASTGSEQ